MHSHISLMLNNWFNKSDDNQAGRLKQSFDGPSHGSTVELSRPSADLIDEKPQRAITTALSTPHDAVLAELHGREVEADIPGREQLAIEDPHQRRLNNPYPARPDFLTDFSPTSDPLFDPFTGAHIGDLQPGEARQDLGAKSEDELWGHLSKILKLQSDIADRHVKMEGIGLKKPGPTLDKSKEGGINRRPSTSGGREWGEGVADEGVDEEADEEAETKRKREEEFSRLTSKFTGRRDAIDGIMKDLDELSSALTTFHALRTPIIDFKNNPNPASPSISTTTPSAIRSASQPTPTPLPPDTLHSPPAALSPGTQKRHSLPRLLPLLDEARPAVVDSPDSIGVELPDVRNNRT